jgi:hypothetical protein
MTNSEAGLPGGGVLPADLEVTVTARGGAVKKNFVYAFALQNYTNVSADLSHVSEAYTPGRPGYCYANICGGNGPVAGQIRAERFCVALEDIADEGTGRVKVRGFVQAKVGDSLNGTIAFGRELAVGPRITGATDLSDGGILDARTMVSSSGVHRKVVAFLLQAFTTASSSDGQTCWVDFDGWNGMGASGEI